MMSIKENLIYFQNQLPERCRLVAISKTHSIDKILEVYEYGQKIFGENKVQELVPKYEALPKDIEWHMVGHLQSNKVKYIARFIDLIHSVDSIKLLKEINKEAQKNNRIVHCLLQIHIADEETKFGLSFEDAEAMLQSEELSLLKNICIKGFMGMATNTDDTAKVRTEFKSLKQFFDNCKIRFHAENIDICELSMGMSSDYRIAIEEGSTLVRIGSAIFGTRVYDT